MNKTSDSTKCLIGKTAIVTGGNSGLGYGAVSLLASRGCKVIIADCDNAEKSKTEIIKMTGNPNISYKHLDLSSFKSIRNFANEIKKEEKKIDILVNNAGIGATTKETTEDGNNFVMQVNFFGAFLLTHLLLEQLKSASEGARIIFLGSITMFLHNLKMENLNITNFEKNDYYTKILYSNSKLCNGIAAQEFGKRLEKFNITAYSVDPMAVKSQIFNKTFPIYTDRFMKLVLWIGVQLFGQTGIEAAQTIFHLSTSELTKIKNGGHFMYCSKMIKPLIMHDQEFCRKIWEETEKIVKLSDEEKI